MLTLCAGLCSVMCEAEENRLDTLIHFQQPYLASASFVCIEELQDMLGVIARTKQVVGCSDQVEEDLQSATSSSLANGDRKEIRLR